MHHRLSDCTVCLIPSSTNEVQPRPRNPQNRERLGCFDVHISEVVIRSCCQMLSLCHTINASVILYQDALALSVAM